MSKCFDGKVDVHLRSPNVLDEVPVRQSLARGHVTKGRVTFP